MAVWLKQENDVACFEQRNPISCSSVGDTGVIGQAADVEQLADAACTELDETLEKVQILDSDELSQSRPGIAPETPVDHQ